MNKNNRTRENLRYCKGHNIQTSGSALGRPKKATAYNAKQAHADESERIEVEQCFSLAKCACGMGFVRAKLQETAARVLVMSVLALNLRRIQHTFLLLRALLLSFKQPQTKLGFVQ